MVSRDISIKIMIVVVVAVMVVGFGLNILNNISHTEEKRLFPGIIGDSILKNNETGIYFIKNMILYDDFRGPIVQGYKANYSSINGTIIIFIAQMTDNITANRSLKDMVTRIGYNDSISFNNTDTNWAVLKLQVQNPEVYVINKDNRSIPHYTFSKLDKVYWIGFSNEDIDYQLDMLVEIFRMVDKTKGSFDDI